MVDDAVILTPERRDAGKQILDLTDHAGFGATGAAWVFDATAEHWHYLLVSPMIDSKGPRWVYDRLLMVFSKTPLPTGITPLDIVIASPREAFFRNFPLHALRTNIGILTAMDLRDVVISGVRIDYMSVYRMERLGRDTGDRTRRFDARVSAMMAA